METPIFFSDIPNDIQLSIISFLQPMDISSLARTCRHFSSLCNPSSPSLWFARCDRRWGTKTNLLSWSATTSHRLYKTLLRFETLIGFWFLVNNNIASSPSLVSFEWLPSCVTGFIISPSPHPGSYSVRKMPFLWLGLSAAGERLSCFLPDFTPVTVDFIGCDHFVVEERRMDLRLDYWDGLMTDLVMPERYQYFANREDERKRRKKERERVERRRWEADHFVRISNCFPTPARPLQGLWKVIMCFEVIVFCLISFQFGVWKRGVNWLNQLL